MSTLNTCLLLVEEEIPANALLFLAANFMQLGLPCVAGPHHGLPHSNRWQQAAGASTNHNGISLFVHGTRPFVYIAKRTVRNLCVVKY